MKKRRIKKWVKNTLIINNNNKIKKNLLELEILLLTIETNWSAFWIIISFSFPHLIKRGSVILFKTSNLVSSLYFAKSIF